MFQGFDQLSELLQAKQRFHQQWPSFGLDRGLDLEIWPDEDAGLRWDRCAQRWAFKMRGRRDRKAWHVECDWEDWALSWAIKALRFGTLDKFISRVVGPDHAIAELIAMAARWCLSENPRSDLREPFTADAHMHSQRMRHLYPEESTNHLHTTVASRTV